MKATNSVKHVLPVHSLERNDKKIYVRPIEYENPYDYTREHRHTYFEIFFFNTGGGMQLIDFIQYPVKEHSCYLVAPQQVHLLKRGESTGLLVQFNEEMLSQTAAETPSLSSLFYLPSAIMFERNPPLTKKFSSFLKWLSESTMRNTAHSNYTAQHLLQAMLHMLLDIGGNNDISAGNDSALLKRFRQLLEKRYESQHLVQYYAKELATSEKKLAVVTRKHLGQTPLQVIHNRILLEAKRLLLFEEISHKEIAYRLGFDSPGNFSQFIKNKTGFTPTGLTRTLVDIHNQ